MDLAEIEQKAKQFEEELDRLKQANPLPGSEWYRYSTMSNVADLSTLLADARRELTELASDLPIADIGCADGDLSFFFERLGFEVDALDNPGTALNKLTGLRRMKDLLGSNVNIHEVDLDSRFDLPRERYGLALLLGVLYHLKNPFYIAERLSHQAKYCFLSTRVTRTIPGIEAPVDEAPIAYLVGESELNNDATNYWIFTSAGLRRMLARAGWLPIAWTSVGHVSGDSDPNSCERDERVFCLLASRRALQHVRLLDGFYEAEADGWRWTAQRFAAALPSPPGHRGKAELRLDVFVPGVILERVGAPTLSACVAGKELGAQTLDREGHHAYVRQIEISGREDVRVDFELDRAMPPQGADCRTLGVVVQRLDLERSVGMVDQFKTAAP